MTEPSSSSPAPADTAAATALTAPLIRLEVEYDRRISWAMQQNSVPVVKRIHVSNGGGEEVQDLRVDVRISGGISRPWTCKIDRLAPGATWNLAAVDLVLDGDSLSQRVERDRAMLTSTVSAGAGDISLVRRDDPVEVLAFNEWPGSSSLPEIIAAFALPNHPQVQELLLAAAGKLGLRSGRDAIDGYLSRDPARSRAIVCALYDAVSDQRISYLAMPPSFEAEGQKIRLPEQLLERRQGNCLDLTMLFAAAIEAAGLHPLVVFVEGHAFAGAWLVDDAFSTAVIDDIARIRNRMKLGELLFFECTGAAQSPAVDFERAVLQAAQRLEDDATFHWLVDIRAARRLRILPLPARIFEKGARVLEEGRAPGPAHSSPVEAAGKTAGDAPSGVSTAPPAAPKETPNARIEKWKRKLLDLTFNNRLLAWRDTRRSVPLLGHDLGRLEDALSGGETFAVGSRPTLMEEGDPRSAAVFTARTGLDAVQGYLAEELAKGRLHSSLGEAELEARMVEIYRAARLSIDETGANTLFLALGFLCFRESPGSTIERRAPILLLPVELLRQAAGEPIRLRQGDDDPRLNQTLIEKIRADFRVEVKGLEEIPEDETGIDLRAVFAAFREAIKNQAHWEVREEAVLGLFSFTKFVMWSDLEARSGKLLESPVVAHLVGRPDHDYEDGREFPDPARLDDEIHPKDFCCPLDADASQLAAIVAGARQKSFVLEGPPGTGKSQTISNLIAHAITAGQRVLFVSEKRAALEVVHQRLKRVGLEEFCLELHSNKASKREVLEQFDQALKTERRPPADDWESGGEKIQALRRELNTFVRSMHAPRKTGFTVFQAVAKAAALGRARRLDLAPAATLGLDREAYDRAIDLTGRFALAAQPFAPLARHALRAIGLTDYQSTLPGRLRAQAALLAEAAERTGGLAKGLIGKLDAGAAEAFARPTRSALERLAALATLLAGTPGPARFLLLAPGWAELKSRAEALFERLSDRDVRRTRLNGKWKDDFLQADLTALGEKLAAARASNFLVRPFKVRGVLKEIASLARAAAVRELEVDRDLAEGRAWQALDRDLASEGSEGRELFGDLWRRGTAEVGALKAVVDWAERFRGALQSAAEDQGSRAAAFREAIVELAVSRRDMVKDSGPHGAAIREFENELRSLRGRLDAMGAEWALDRDILEGGAEEAGYPDRLLEAAAGWQREAADLDRWCVCIDLREQLHALALQPVVRLIEEDGLGEKEAEDAACRSIVEAWIDRTADEEETLRRFNSRDRERSIERFREQDRARLAAAMTHARALLAARVPEAGSSAAESKGETGLLARQIKLRRNQMSVRKLLKAIPNLAFRLKPCFLMSPLSVAQFLDPDLPAFDLIVFDEASQIPVWDAIGALARGRSAVVVGDSKQLPPTSFFQRIEGDEEIVDEDQVEEVESVLDECLAARLPSLSLRWHYRSRHEELIAFSNHHYYSNRLHTFPAAIAEAAGLGVSLVRLPAGSYDKGRSRTNRAEAEALVLEITRRLLDPAEPEARKSIGVVTFSKPQQDLVLDLLDRARVAEPELERWFGDETPEPVFVKNLENVQGDERTIILFSIGYGRDAAGRMTMSFGPLNGEGGERRLNVAVTRAREQLVVYSTIGAEDIDLAKSQAIGVAHLKTFLDYAARGPAAIAEAITLGRPDAFESPLEEQIAAVLRAKGHAVDTQVGCSGYRIDLAVKDAERPGEYLVGIECDGRSYHSAATARDRDRLRQSVLASLGWQLLRVWSTDWWRRPAETLATLEAGIAAAREKSKAVREAAARREADAAARTAPAAAPPVEPAPSASPAASSLSRPASPVYQVFVKDVLIGEPEAFFGGQATPALREKVTAIVACEAPLHFDELCRRAASFWGIERLTGRLRARVQNLIDALPATQRPRLEEGFVWAADQISATFETWRLPGPGAQRSADQIPLAEIAAAMRHILQAQLSLTPSDLARETARLFGITRMGGKVTQRMEDALRHLLARGQARPEGERVVIC